MPGSILKVGGPAFPAFIADAGLLLPVPCIRSPSLAYSDAEAWSADLLDYPVEILNAAVSAGSKIHMLPAGSPSSRMIADNFTANVNAAGLTDSFRKLFSAVIGSAICVHEMGHLIDMVFRFQAGLPNIGYSSNPTVLSLTTTVLAAARAYELGQSPGTTIPGTGGTYGATNQLELVAESYAALVDEIRDPATISLGLRRDAYLQTALCNGSASLATSWRAELRRSPLWPASNTWNAVRTRRSFLITARFRTGTIQDFYSNEAPTLLFGNEPGGLSSVAPANGTTLTSWGRWDRPISAPASRLTSGAASEVAVTAAATGSPAIGPVPLLGVSSAFWRTTIVFKATTASTSGVYVLLWSARYLDPVTNIDTEYCISMVDSQLTATWITRTNTGTTISAQSAISANGTIVAGEVITVQATFSEGAVPVVLKTRKESAGTAITVSSAGNMGTTHAPVPAWSIPLLGSTLPAMKIKAVAVEAQTGITDQWTQLDSTYSTIPTATPVFAKTGVNWLNVTAGDYNMGNTGPTGLVTASNGTLSGVTCSWPNPSAAPTVSGSGTSRTLTFSGNPGATQYIGAVPLPAVDANSDAVDILAFHGAKFVPNASFPIQSVTIRIGTAMTVADTAKIFIRPTSSAAPLTGDTPDGTLSIGIGVSGILTVPLTNPVSVTSGVSYTMWVLGTSSGVAAKLALYASAPNPTATGNLAMPATGAQYVTANKLTTGTPTKVEQSGTFMHVGASAIVRTSTVLTINATIDGTVRTTTITVYGFYEP